MSWHEFVYGTFTFFLLLLIAVKHLGFSALLNHLTSYDLIPRDLAMVWALMTWALITTTALFLHELRGCRRVASELGREAKGIWRGTQKWDLFWLEYRVRVFCFDYWDILISTSKARLTFSSQFSCPPQGMWVSSSVVLSCWLGLNHNTPKNRVGN